MAKTTVNFANALDHINNHAESQRLTVFYTLQEGVGRRLAQQAQVEHKTFDWPAFKAQFQKDYAHLSLPELLRHCQTYLGLRTIEEVADRHRAYKKAYYGRQQRRSA